MPSMQVEASDKYTDNQGIEYLLDSTNYTATVSSDAGVNSTDIVIPSKVGDNDEYTVTSIDDCAFYMNNGITSVTIPSSVTSIGKQVFAECMKLITVTFEGELTTIGSEVFEACMSLTTINVTSEMMKTKIEGEEIGNVNVVIISAKDTTTDTTDKTDTTDTTDKTDTTDTSDKTDTTDITNTYIPPAWVPTDPADIYRFSLCGAQDPDYKVLSSVDSVRMVREVQGPLFFDAVALVQGDYTLAKTYNIFVNNILTYYNGNSVKIELQIPEDLQKEGRTFRMFCVTQDGAIISLTDLDNDPTTITFETDKFYAFALAYAD